MLYAYLYLIYYQLYWLLKHQDTKKNYATNFLEKQENNNNKKKHFNLYTWVFVDTQP